MGKHIRGSIFADYVDMIRKNKSVDWSKHISPGDLELTKQIILPGSWYPLEVFSRLGEAIFREVGKGNLEAARLWGRVSVDRLSKLYSIAVLVKGSPLKTLEKFKKISHLFFDFEGFEFTVRGDNHVSIKISPEFGRLAAAAYTHQILGSFQRLVELAGAQGVKAEFSAKSWEGRPQTVIELSWQA